ncbi:Soluble aldose sugar dehydrogenase YliI precursor [Candidatus Nitrosocosmicus oleophilus]|jgi:aldose sugar dehydrogenase|uniref:Soluble aldose sugar dehydrogenase YliI n=1 Tax=Candidatus Nitrosocosmicus oleophilus TaxID=1353260 RepID=A0A654LW36_9ARCH|nr:Soluble aldose sugar dehydrogenase YliI precursor [Candidatus Nitrosocosmicus oleophilus]
MAFKLRSLCFTGLLTVWTCLLILLITQSKSLDIVLTSAQTLKDPNLSLQPIYNDFTSPTGMAFLDDSGKNIIVIEKKGNVKLISGGILQDTPLKQFDVNFESERGLLGVQVMKENNTTLVFFYVTENDADQTVTNPNENLRNRIYSFEWDGNDLINQKLILDLPAIPGPNHNGGKITLGKDNNLYVIIGDLNHRTKLQNFENGGDPDFTGSIYRIDPHSGSAPGDNPFVESDVPNIDKTFAYGIRNSFGLTVDPITGNIWDTENGPSFSDEINLVEPGFNSGWRSIMGPASSADEIKALVFLSPNSNYSDPEISWLEPTAVTDIEFINSTSLGPDYTNNILVGDNNNGNLYFFKLNDQRNGLEIQDAVIDSEEELNNYILGTGFGSITDIQTGPDGDIYVVSLESGSIYKIS